RYLYLPPIVYFKPVKLKNGKPAEEEHKKDDKKLPRIPAVFPNPVRSGLNASLQFADAAAGRTLVYILDARGNIIRTQQVMIAAGNSTVSIRTAGLMPGIYMVQVVGATNAAATLKLIIY
ncbi:MAG TPA: T9SS type A sorting domain-containing protein, partial [Chitinophagaceae bacterium]|nr:T9SS type A sorting domain-containing protein [Chitinophagaceae bacterium]